MRRSLPAALLFCVLGSACRQESAASKDEPVPVVWLDAEHQQFERKFGETGKKYRIPAGTSFMLDTGAFKPHVFPAHGVKTPNIILVGFSKERIYSLPWRPDRSVYEIGPETVAPYVGEQPFPELVSGAQLVLSIGYQPPGAPPEDLMPMWLGVIDVE